jgi:hypothetical protein
VFHRDEVLQPDEMLHREETKEDGPKKMSSYQTRAKVRTKTYDPLNI